jgi:GMP synthase-like glutamine amidotransferase
MSEDVSTPVPEQPGQDPESPLEEPRSDGVGLSGSPHSGYEEEMEADGVEAPAQDRVDGGS